jgi:Asp-tRNA(Asn)/Glu-tRNA(Gln) amidotransferase A subunit family amidase
VVYSRPKASFMSGADEQAWRLCEYDPSVYIFAFLILILILILISNVIDDDAQEFDGLPVSLQLVGRRFEDEKVLAVLEYIHRVVKLPFCGKI